MYGWIPSIDRRIYNDHPFMDLKKIVSRDFMDECLIINVNVLIFVSFFYVFTQRNIKGVSNLKQTLTSLMSWFRKSQDFHRRLRITTAVMYLIFG